MLGGAIGMVRSKEGVEEVLRLVVLGNSGAYPGPRGACSGYLVVEGDTRLLLDCGPGVMANVQTHLSIEDLSAVFISHMHPDHFMDLVPLRYAYVYGKHRRSRPLPVYLPPGGDEMWERIGAVFDETDGAFSAPYALSEYKEGRSCRVGALNVRVSPLPHHVPGYGFEVRGGGKFVYSGDTRPCPELVALAQGADLFLCEATFLEDEVVSGERGHLTAREAGEIAAEAGVGRLLLTHIHPDVDARDSLETARAAFDGDVSLAELGETYTVKAD